MSRITLAGLQELSCTHASDRFLLPRLIHTSSHFFRSAGAVAQFYDISCLAATQSPTFVIVQDVVFSLWNGSDQFNQQDLVVLDKLTTATWEQPIVLGTHFFQENSTGNGISPVFDYRAASRQQDPQGFVLAAGQGTLPAPTDPTTDVNWLQLKGVSGNLGSTVFRVDTIGGQPLASVCHVSPKNAWSPY